MTTTKPVVRLRGRDGKQLVLPAAAWEPFLRVAWHILPDREGYPVSGLDAGDVVFCGPLVRGAAAPRAGALLPVGAAGGRLPGALRRPQAVAAGFLPAQLRGLQGPA